MAVPTSGSISLRSVARERRIQSVGIDSYSSGAIPPGPYSLRDVMVGGNANGSGFDYCPPMDNIYLYNGFNYTGPYDPNLSLGGIGPSNEPMGLSEFRGHQGNRELGCMKVNFSTECYPVGNSSVSVAAAGQSVRYEFDFDYSPKGSGALVYMELSNGSFAGISSTSDTTGGSGDDLTSFGVTVNGAVMYLNIATNPNPNTRSFVLSVYVSGSCYTTENLLHNITVTQAAAAGGGGGGGGPIQNPGGGSQ